MSYSLFVLQYEIQLSKTNKGNKILKTKNYLQYTYTSVISSCASSMLNLELWITKYIYLITENVMKTCNNTQQD